MVSMKQAEMSFLCWLDPLQCQNCLCMMVQQHVQRLMMDKKNRMTSQQVQNSTFSSRGGGIL